MILYSFMIFFGISCLVIVSYSSPLTDKNDAVMNLKIFEYLKTSDGEETLSIMDQEVSTEIKNFQISAGLNVAGQLGGKTISMMSAVRFGMKNIIRQHESGKKKQDTEGSAAPDTSTHDGNFIHIGSAAPDICADATIDAITRIQNGSTYVFKGEYYWKVIVSGIPEGYPKKISDNWDGLPGNLDAAFTWPDGETFFFKGNQYWRFINKKMSPHYPKLISRGFEGCAPDNFNAAFVWSNGNAYFFKDNKYWRCEKNNDPPMEAGSYPADISAWSPLLEGGVNAAIKDEDGRTYFFKGDRYYVYDDQNSKVEGDVSHSTSVNWFFC